MRPARLILLAGIALAAVGCGGTFDYAFTDGGALGAIHRLSIGGRF